MDGNRGNTTKVLDSSRMGDAQLQKEVFDFAEKLGQGKLKNVPNTNDRWYIKTQDGATINVRSKSSSHLSDGSQPRWTIEIREDVGLNKSVGKRSDSKLEIKFK